MKRKTISKHKKMMKECDQMWSEIVKIKAGYKSEYSGKKGKEVGGYAILNSHHLIGKSSLALRYNIENGSCITNGEHFYIAGVEGRKEMFKQRIIEVRGYDVFAKLRANKFKTSTTLSMYYLYLKQALEELKK
jgi:hypothetical protein